MHILCIYSRHHMGWIVTDHNFFQEGAGPTINYKKALAVPFRLVDELLIMTRPHIVAVIHLLGRKRNLLLYFPVFPHIDHGHGTWIGRAFMFGLLILSIDPDFAYASC